ncbi:FAD-dependent oxidoreductase [Streptomyces rubiginosohelvolus]|uniref:FAD-dependent oxidoreductase n=1 Tax=Streptomyces rubiginosohelvolus TaxID=67362 RepID=UPI0037B4D507
MSTLPDQGQKAGYDVIVVGNGALGSSTAVELARRGASVCLVGRPHRPFAASTAAGAMLGCFGEVTTGLLDNTYGQAKFTLDLRAKDVWPQWLESISGGLSDGQDILTAKGTTVLLNSVGTGPIDSGNYEAIRATLDKHDEPWETVDPADVDWLDPDPNSRPLQALHIPGEHAVDSGRLLLRLTDTARALGVDLIDGQALSVVDEDGRARGVVLEDGRTLSAGQVLLAGGVGTQTLVDSVPGLGDCIPRLVSGVGISALVTLQDGTQPESVIRTPNRAFACGLHVVPRGAGRVYVGATNIVSPHPLADPVMGDLLFLLECAHRQTRRNLWSSTVSAVNVGNRPISLDGFPLLGESPLDGLWLMTGTYRDGLFLSPLLAKEFASRMLEGKGEQDLDAFAPERAPLQGLSREAVVEATMEHTLATGYEQGWTVPTGWQEYFDVSLKPVWAQWADELDPDFTPQPDVLAAARTEPEIAKWLRTYYENSRAKFAAPHPAAPDTVRRHVERAAELLTAVRVPTGRADALELAAYVLEQPSAEATPDAALDAVMTEAQTGAFWALVGRRAEREPLEYLTGRAPFFDLRLDVGPGARVPQRRSETLVAEALSWCTAEQPRVVDLFTASGALAIAVAARRPGAKVTGVDDAAALTWARRNARTAGAGDAVAFVEGKAGDPELLADLAGGVQLITAVVPSVPDRVQIAPELSAHQPRAAVRGGWDGLDAVRATAAAAARLLADDGVLAIEHDDALADQVIAVVREAGFDAVASRTDEHGHPRFLIARRSAA